MATGSSSATGHATERPSGSRLITPLACGSPPSTRIRLTRQDDRPRCLVSVTPPPPPAPPAPPADLLPVGPTATLGFRFVRLWAEPLLLLIFRTPVRGQDNIPPNANFIITPTHPAYPPP